MKKNLLFIINPISGTRQKKSIPGEIERYLNHDLYDYRIAYTERAGHASQLAKEAAEEGVDIVVAVGGDGTINEVARSLVHTRAALAIIPCGSGNGLARHLQIPTNARGALEIINKGVVHCLDYGRLNGRPFFCTCGVGFDAFVSQKFAESGKRGLLQYAKNTIGIGLTYKPERYTISYDGQTETSEAFLITCANASQYGNNAFIAPTASMKDGLMDIIIMRPFPTIEGGVVLLQMFTKNLLSNAHVDLLRTSHIHISREKEGAVHCDGDPIKMGRELDIDLERRGINIVVNPEAHTQRRNYLVEVGEQIGHLFDGSLSLIPTGKKSEDEPADEFNLNRFLKAQQNTYEDILGEIRAVGKRGDWISFIFPQLRRLATTEKGRTYGISGRKEAEAYLAHPILGKRLTEVTEEILSHQDYSRRHTLTDDDVDQLRACMTLFATIAEEGNVFEHVLNKYFKGAPCRRTLWALELEREEEEKEQGTEPQSDAPADDASER